MTRLPLLAFLALVVAGCGGQGARSTASMRRCIEDRVPRSAYATVVASTEEGVVSLDYHHRDGDETVVSIFPHESDAVAAEKAEARLGDAHDRRLHNVLYRGGGPIEAAVRACAA